MNLAHQPPATTSQVIFSSHPSQDAAIAANIGSRTFFSTLDRATQAFRRCLMSLGYNPTACREACQMVREFQETACLVQLGYIDAEDEAALEAAFSEGFDETPLSSGAWDVVDDKWGLPEPTAEEIADALIKPKGTPTPEDARTFAELDGTHDIRAKLTKSDWQNYVDWAEWRDQAYVEPGRFLEAELAEFGCGR